MIKSILPKSLLVGGLALLASSSSFATSFNLWATTATVVGGNTTSSFYNVLADGTESGSMAASYSTTFGGDENTGYWVKISFDGNPRPELTSAFLKASNKYLWWDSADLAAFNSDIFDSIILRNSGAGGIQNSNHKYQTTSHAGLNGIAGTSVPDGGVTIALVGLGLVGLGGLRRRLIRR